MGAAFFYHLTREPLEAALPKLIGSARKAGWRVMVRGPDPARLEWLDRRLWLLGGDDAFLPHGLAGGPHDADQPVLLGSGEEAANGAQCLMSIDGGAVSPADLARHERVCVLFDGGDPAAVEFARGQWKSLTGAGAAAEYWAQEDTGWVCKSRSGG